MAPSSISVMRSMAVAVGLGGAALLAGCGGGGSGGGVPRPAPGFQLGTPPTVLKLETPLGLAGSRGSGADVYVAFNLKDREYNAASIQLEYGWDVDLDADITGSEGDPTTTDEYFECTPAANPGDGLAGLDTATGQGADHLFIWASGQDLPGARFVTQDYDYTEQGRLKIGSDGQPKFGNTPGIRLRMRANDNAGAGGRWGQWKITNPFDLNNNSQPAVVIEPVGLNGVTPNPTGSAADTDAVLNFRVIDADANTGTDLNAVAVDFAPVAPGADLSDPAVVDALAWLPATTTAGTADTGLVSDVVPGALNTWSWDSVADVGTVNGDYILRITPFDSKQERGATVMMPERFRLDNYTIFTDAGAALSAPRVGHRATTLLDGRVLVSGGRTTAAGASVSTAEIFYPGIGQTTFGAVAATGSLNTARSFHSQTRLFDDKVLVAGGYDASGNPLSSMELYDAATSTWTTMGVTLGAARARHTAVLLANGDVLFAGGVDGSGALASAVVYRFDTGTVAAVGSMAAGRHSVAGALLPDGKVLIPGGKDFAGTALSSTELFDPVAGTFTAGPAMTSARADHAVAAMTDGRVLVSGGTGLSTVSIYDGRTNSWDNTPPAMSSARAGHVGVLMGDGSILLAGGSDGATVVSSANLFDPSTGNYDAPNNGMADARRDAAVAVLNNGRVLIVGGLDAAGAPLASLEIFTPDGAFNYVPSARILTPTEPQSWAFGALFSYRLMDPETDPAKVIFQYSISGGAWRTCTSKGGAWDDGLADTIAGDVNEGLVDLATADADSVLPIDPILKNTLGDHLFVWDIMSDIARADYDSVRVRVLPFGAGRGATATSTAFKIAYNTRVIPRFAPFTGAVSGTVTIDYHLQDIDGALPLPDPNGDGARVEFDYGIDMNGDRQILALDGESWKTCSRVPGSEGLGAGYTLATAKAFDPTVGTLGWHQFTWDSIRDIGSPAVGETRTDVMLRITPYDFPAGVEETKGRQETVGVDQGLTVILDPSGLYLVSWGTEGGVTYSGTAIGNVKLDETLVFNFNQEVDPATVDGIVGRTTLAVTVGGRTVLGTYQADPTDYTVVRFFPQLNNSTNGAPVYNGTENPTILVRGATVAISIPAYVPGGASPETADILRIRNFVPGDPAVGIVNLLAFDFSPALTTSSSAGTAAYFSRGIAPTVATATPLHNSTGQALNQGFSIEFDGQLNGETISIATAKIVVDLNGNGVADANDSIMPGSFSVVNTAGPAGTRKSILTFTPLSGFNYPAGSRILASFAGVTAGDGTVAKGPGGGSPVAWFSTVAGATTTTTFAESFNDQVNMDAAETNALWNNTSLGFGGMLTGLRDGGTGADGTPTATLVGNVRTFSAKDTWNFTTFTVPKNEIWRFTGGASNLPVKILVTGTIDIAGVVDVSGGDGYGPGPAESKTQTSYPYHRKFTSYQGNGTLAYSGGTGIGGGGKGGNALHMAAGQAGTAGTGASASNAGGGAGLVTYGTGGGGAGHAQNGFAGGQYASGYGSVGVAGTSYGTSDFSVVQTAGSGGGSGSSYPTYYTLYEDQQYYYYMLPGSGGAGGGAVKLVCNGTFNLQGSGVIDASGGDGGNGWAYYFGGGGGAGSGGSVWIISGGNLNVGGIIDVRGGRGGDFRYYTNAYAQGSPARYGSFGGHASAGRIRIQGPNISTTQTKFIGGMHYNTIASGALNGGSGTLGAFPVSATFNADTIPKDGSGFMNFSTMNIPSGTTVTVSGASAAKMRFTGNVSISGVLRSSGGVGANGVYAGGQYSTFSVITGGPGGVGGGKGGIPNTSASNTLTNGGTGTGTGGGQGGTASSGAFPYSWAKYYYGGSGGGGGSNLLNHRGRPGTQSDWGAAYYGTKPGGNAGTGYTDPGSMTLSNIAGGSGGGSGANGQYISSSVWFYNYGAGAGGGGGGGIGIETSGSFTMGSAGRIEVQGGKGGFGYSGYGGGGGGGSGGNVLVRAASLSFTTGAIIDTTPGLGEKAYNTTSTNYGNNGGDGGLGGIRVETVSESGTFFNVGGLLGYTTSTGSFTSANYVTGDKGTTKWQTALGAAPDFHTAGIAVPLNLSGGVDVTIQGAMMDPVTGARSTTLLGSQLVTATPLTQGLATADAIDGFKFWRVVFKLKPPASPTFAVPIVYDATLKVDTK